MIITKSHLNREPHVGVDRETVLDDLAGATEEAHRLDEVSFATPVQLTHLLTRRALAKHGDRSERQTAVI